VPCIRPLLAWCDAHQAFSSWKPRLSLSDPGIKAGARPRNMCRRMHSWTDPIWTRCSSLEVAQQARATEPDLQSIRNLLLSSPSSIQMCFPWSPALHPFSPLPPIALISPPLTPLNAIRRSLSLLRPATSSILACSVLRSRSSLMRETLSLSRRSSTLIAARSRTVSAAC
jgi:hypothetical protein